MEKDKELTDEISFVAKRYRENKFNVPSAWKRLNLAPVSNWSWRRFKVAAAIGVAMVLAAVAGTVIYYNSYFSKSSASEPEPIETVTNPSTIVKTIDFEYAPLSQVVESIKDVYGVEVENVPEKADNYNLSMHFEGNPVELIDAINEILGTEMSIKQLEKRKE